MPNNKVIVIVGPTASGKTLLSLRIAELFDGEIVSADSMQIYKYMDIGTAKPTPEQMQTVPHHMIDFVSPLSTYTLADYLTDAKKCIDDILRRGKLPIITGGTGLYVSALADNIKLADMAFDEDFRAYLADLARRQGAYALRRLLRSVDETAAEKIHDGDIKRASRGLEVYRQTGKTPTELNRESKREPSPYDFYMIGLNYSDRAELYKRINDRVEQMFKDGLQEEVSKLRDSGMFRPGSTAYQAIGYRQFGEYFEGRITIDELKELIKRDTRRYAKRQLTWFRRDPRIKWINMVNPDDEYLDDLIKKLRKDIEIFLKV